MQLTQLKINYLICAFLYLIYLLFNFKIFLLIFSLIVFTLPFFDIGKEIDKCHGIEGKNKSRLGGFLILLAMIFSYYFIERPARQKRYKFRIIFSLIIFFITFLIIANLNFLFKQGYKDRFDINIQTGRTYNYLTQDGKNCFENIEICFFELKS